MTDKLSDKDKKLWLDHMKQTKDPTHQEIEDFATLLDEIESEADIPIPKPTKKVAQREDTKVVIKNQHTNQEPLDQAMARKLSQGKIKPEGKIDLHGLNQHQAYNALCNYIEERYHQGKKYILVVTGKGKSIKQPQNWFTPSVGVLKQKLPYWIKTKPLQYFIIDAIPAHPKDGGGGAFYVVLKKKK